MLFIRLLMVRGSFSATFPVIALRVTPAWVRGGGTVVPVYPPPGVSCRGVGVRRRRRRQRQQAAVAAPGAFRSFSCRFCFISFQRRRHFRVPRRLLCYDSGPAWMSFCGLLVVPVWTVQKKMSGGGVLALLELAGRLQCGGINSGLEPWRDVDAHIRTESSAPQATRASDNPVETTSGRRKWLRGVSGAARVVITPTSEVAGLNPACRLHVVRLLWALSHILKRFMEDHQC